jgi:hypothetical protein
MNSFAKTSAVLALALPLLALGAPTQRLQKRDGVTCNKSYAGSLVVMNVVADPNLSIPKQTNVYRDEAGYLAADTSNVQEQIRVQFDTCTTEGWNSDSMVLGQFKPEGDNYNCFTLIDSSERPTKVNVQPCGDYNGGILENQWFQGSFDDQGGFHVTYSGNPNDESFYKPSNEISFVYQGDDIPNPNEISFTFTNDTANPDITELQLLGLEYY